MRWVVIPQRSEPLTDPNQIRYAGDWLGASACNSVNCNGVSSSHCSAARRPCGRSRRTRRRRKPATQPNPCASLCRSRREVRRILSRACSQTSFQRCGASRCSSRISQAPAITSAPNTWQGPMPTDIPSCSTPAPLQRTLASIASLATTRLRILRRSRLSPGWNISCSCRIPHRRIPLKNSSTM